VAFEMFLFTLSFDWIGFNQLFLFLSQSIEEWTADNVVEWMAVLNLYRYAGVFKSKDIKGSDLINLDREKLLVSPRPLIVFHPKLTSLR